MRVMNQSITKEYALYNGDSCEVMKGLKADSMIPYLVHHLKVCIHTAIAQEIWEIVGIPKNSINNLLS